MISKANAKIPRFAAEKGFIYKGIKGGDRRTSLGSITSKGREQGYLGVKSRGRLEVKGKVIEGRKNVRLSLFCAGISLLHASSWDACSEYGGISMS